MKLQSKVNIYGSVVTDSNSEKKKKLLRFGFSFIPELDFW